jgi:hypothetical protein
MDESEVESHLPFRGKNDYDKKVEHGVLKGMIRDTAQRERYFSGKHDPRDYDREGLEGNRAIRIAAERRFAELEKELGI